MKSQNSSAMKQYHCLHTPKENKVDVGAKTANNAPTHETDLHNTASDEDEQWPSSEIYKADVIIIRKGREKEAINYQPFMRYVKDTKTG